MEARFVITLFVDWVLDDTYDIDMMTNHVLSGKTRRLAAEDDCPPAQTGTSRCDRAMGGSQGEIV